MTGREGWRENVSLVYYFSEKDTHSAVFIQGKDHSPTGKDESAEVLVGRLEEWPKRAGQLQITVESLIRMEDKLKKEKSENKPEHKTLLLVEAIKNISNCGESNLVFPQKEKFLNLCETCTIPSKQ